MLIILFIFLIINVNNVNCVNKSLIIKPKIVGGITTHEANTIYYVSLSLRFTDLRESFFCGGTVLNKGLILTAAHCLFITKHKNVHRLDIAELLVVWGCMHRFFPTKDTLALRVKRYIVHKQFQKDPIRNDIALIILKDEFPLKHPASDGAKLPNIPPIEGQSCKAIGFGKTSKDAKPSNYLEEVDLLIMPNLVCKYLFDANTKHHFCAGDDKNNVCFGDSGGPLFCNSNIITGIVSFGTDCGHDGYPAAFTNVYEYLDWIAENNSPTSSFIFKTIFWFCTIASCLKIL